MEMWNKAKKLENKIYGDGTVKNDAGLKGELTQYYSNRSNQKDVVMTPEIRNFK